LRLPISFDLHPDLDDSADNTARPPLAHAFRHATAVHLISAGFDVTIIRIWLGQLSLDTTNYAKANLETNRKALEQVAAPTTASGKSSWKRDASILAWLDEL